MAKILSLNKKTHHLGVHVMEREVGSSRSLKIIKMCNILTNIIQRIDADKYHQHVHLKINFDIFYCFVNIVLKPIKMDKFYVE